MSAASLRPGRDLTWLAALRERLLHNVRASSAAITTHVGSFLHDIDQARRRQPRPRATGCMPGAGGGSLQQTLLGRSRAGSFPAWQRESDVV